MHILFIYFLCFGYTGSLIKCGNFSCSGAWAQLLCSMWVLVPQSGIEPTYPTLESRFLTTGTPGKYKIFFSVFFFFFFKLFVKPQFSFLKYNVKYFREGRSREAFWGRIILVFLRAIFCCIHMRTHPCLKARETSLCLRGTTFHEATFCSIQSSLL